MFITKKHLSRRTVLKGAGVAVALPFLDAMVPAATATAQTAAAPKLRAGSSTSRMARSCTTPPTGPSGTDGRRAEPAPTSS